MKLVLLPTVFLFFVMFEICQVSHSSKSSSKCTCNCPCDKDDKSICENQKTKSFCPCEDPPDKGDVDPCDPKPPLCYCGNAKNLGKRRRSKRDVRERQSLGMVYPSPGGWYKDTASGKYYFHLGNTVYVERNDGYYSKWVTSGNGAKWSLNDNFMYKWDKTGKWFAHKEDDGRDEDGSCNVEKNKFEVPIKCIGGKCPEQIRFPSDGAWYTKDGKEQFVYDDGKARYEIQPNGFYKKFVANTQVCPDNWTWNFSTGEWYPLKSSSRSTCSMEDPTPPNGGPTREREGLLPPPRDVFLY